MSKETLGFIEQGYNEAKACSPDMDYESFVAGAKFVIDHLIKQNRI